MSFQQQTETNELRETDLPVNLKTNACVSASDVFRLNQTNNDLTKIHYHLMNNAMFGKRTNNDLMKIHYHVMNNSMFGKNLSK